MTTYVLEPARLPRETLHASRTVFAEPYSYTVSAADIAAGAGDARPRRRIKVTVGHGSSREPLARLERTVVLDEAAL